MISIKQSRDAGIFCSIYNFCTYVACIVVQKINKNETSDCKIAYTRFQTIVTFTLIWDQQ